MITYYKNNKGLTQTENREDNCWINVVCPTKEETKFLLKELQIPEDFYNDIEDIDERPRIEIENDWTLIILRIPFRSNDAKLPFNTAPLGLMFKGDVFVSLCFHESDILPDFVSYTKRKKITINNHFDLVLKLLFCPPAFGSWNTWNKSISESKWLKTTWKNPSKTRNSLCCK